MLLAGFGNDTLIGGNGNDRLQDFIGRNTLWGGEGNDVPLAAKVELAEISGSDTFVHLDTPVGEVVAQLTGVHYFDLGAVITLYFNPALAYVFDADGMLLLSPVRGGEH